MAVGSTLTITELTGTKNKLEFTGRSLPYRDLPFEGKMRAEFTHYAGNPIATAQLLGGEEGGTMIHGRWSDRFVSPFEVDDDDNITGVSYPAGAAKLNNLVLGSAADIVTAVDGFRRRGQLLNFSWDFLTRVGIMTRFKHVWARHEIVDWEIEFEWISQGEPYQPSTFAIQKPPTDIAAQLISALQSLQAAILAPFAVIQSVTNAITDATDALQDVVAVASDTATKLNQLVLSPLDASKKMTAALSTAIVQAQTIGDAVVSVPSRALRVSESIASVTQGQALQAAQWARNVRIQTRALRYYAARALQETQAQGVAQPILASFLARTGLDLRQVSNQYYGTPDEWRTIAAFNGIQSSKLTAAQTVLVPKLSTSSGSSLVSSQSAQTAIGGS